MWRTLSRTCLRVEALDERLTPATFTVTTINDIVNATDGKLSLREAITKANERPGADVIALPAGHFKIALNGVGDEANLGGDFDVTDSVTITGRGAARTFIDGVQLDRVFHVLGSAPSSIKVHFRNVAIFGGRAFDGAGVLMENADVTMTGCTVWGNTADWSGGGISNFAEPASGNLTLISSIVSSNTSSGGDGGGVYLDGGGRTDIGILTARKSHFRNNQSGASGGGIAGTVVNLTDCNVNLNDSVLWGGGVGGMSVTLNRCQITDNQAGGTGGGVYAGSGATLLRSTVARNVSSAEGGGLYAANGTVRVEFSSLRSNLATGSGGGLRAASVDLVASTVSGNTSKTFGGGLWATVLKLTNCTVSGNSASFLGGGLSANFATVLDCTISANTAGQTGGGLYVVQTATLTGSKIQGNWSGFDGGGLSAGTPSLTNCTVSGNSAAELGGGIHTWGTVNLSGCTLSNNWANHGGGLYAVTANLTSSTVSGNAAVRVFTSNSLGLGGGIYATFANLTNSTVSGNRADKGGGVYAYQGVLLNTTITENRATDGGGLFRPVSTGFFAVKNSIIAQNHAFNGSDLLGTFVSQGHNLIGIADLFSGFANFVNGDNAGRADSPLNPRLGELRYNGGRTQTHALLPGSPAIDKGNNEGATALDQRGVTRLRDGDRNGTRTVDIGAFEK
jgi:CSLREA domain-containing protein